MSSSSVSLTTGPVGSIGVDGSIPTDTVSSIGYTANGCPLTSTKSPVIETLALYEPVATPEVSKK